MAIHSIKIKRKDLQQMVRLRLREAKVLLNKDCPAGAYYLAGYAIECALKACIAKMTERYEFPRKDTVTKSHSHNLDQLLGLAGLRTEFDREVVSHRQFEVNWSIVKDWNEDSRYDLNIDKQKAEAFYRAVTNQLDGVLPWVRRHWYTQTSKKAKQFLQRLTMRG